MMLMEKQRSFTVKPIRFWVFTFTISFSIIFLIFFSTWILTTTTPSSYPESSTSHLTSTQNFNFNTTTTSTTTPSTNSSTSSSSSSEYLLKNSVLKDAHLTRQEISSHIADISISSKAASDDKRESHKVKAVTSDAIVLTGNSSTLTSFGGGGSSSTRNVSDLNMSIVNSYNYSIANSNIIVEKKNSNGNGNSKVDTCDVTKGRWIYDESYPLYTNVTCPYIDEGFNCDGNGRLDKDYMKWRWQPLHCHIPRFNATKMLELIRGKRLVFVGDSVNRNQWESMLCLLMGAVKDPKKVHEARGRKITKGKGNYSFKFEDYKCTVEYYVTHFLVHESKARIGKKRAQTLRIDTIDKGSSRWRGADILVFNTAHWWNHYKTKAGINYYQEGDLLYPQLDVNKAFQRALSTWASWVDKYVDPRKTRVFFRSSAPAHFSGGQWNTGGHCREASQPINETFAFNNNYPEKNLIVEEIISKMKKPVTYLNITHLSDYRRDAHPSMYGRKSVDPGVQDCSHWCLPGVPDNWNELLYYYMLQLRRTKDNFVD